MPGFRPRFFVEGPSLGPPISEAEPLGTEVALSTADSHHASRVLRLKLGDDCEVVVGAAVFSATVTSVEAPMKITLRERLAGEEAGAVYRTQVGLVQALTRPSLLDQVLEKGTEVGASFFTLVSAAGSVPLPARAREARLERWRRIVLEAAKQSKQTAVPSVEFVDSVKDAVDRLQAEGVGSVVLEPSASASLDEVLRIEMASGGAPLRVKGAERTLALWIGPESGWSQEESRRFTEAGLTIARLGQSVLRAETAGPVAVAAARLLIGDW